MIRLLWRQESSIGDMRGLLATHRQIGTELAPDTFLEKAGITFLPETAAGFGLRGKHED